MKNDNYIVITGWMINDLKLSGNDLLVYALIYGFSQDGESWYTGSRNYIADSLGITPRTVSRLLQSLEEQGFIIKEITEYNGVKFNKYRVHRCHGGGQIVLTAGQNVARGVDKLSTNNTNIYNTNNNTRKGFVKPDIHEVDDYCKERGNNINAEAFIDYYESNGWMVRRNKMKDWKACVRSWEKKDFNRKKENKSFPQRKYDYEDLESRLLKRRL